MAISWEMDLRIAYKYVMKIHLKFPTDRAVAHASIGLSGGIVIPVVVGSSPISHPKMDIRARCY